MKGFVSLQNFLSQISPNVFQKVFPSDQCTRFIRTICADSWSVIVFIRLMKPWKIRYEVFLWTMRLMGKQNWQEAAHESPREHTKPNWPLALLLVPWTSYKKKDWEEISVAFLMFPKQKIFTATFRDELSCSGHGHFLFRAAAGRQYKHLWLIWSFCSSGLF